MEKKKKDLAKMVDAQAKGKKVKGVASDGKDPAGRELDARISKIAGVKYEDLV